jgi:Protein of unknown function (DUF3572)
MRGSNSPVDCEVLALNALSFLADSPEEFSRFLVQSGIDAAQLRRRAGDRDFLAGVVDFLLANESLLTRFCESHAVDSRSIHLARAALPSARQDRE